MISEKQYEKKSAWKFLCTHWYQNDIEILDSAAVELYNRAFQFLSMILMGLVDGESFPRFFELEMGRLGRLLSKQLHSGLGMVKKLW